MSDDAKPKASFLGGKKPAAAPASAPAEAPAPQPAATPVPASGGAVGFLKGKGGAPSAAPQQSMSTPQSQPMSSPQPQAMQTPAPQAQPPVMKQAQGNRALALQYLDRGMNHYDRQEIEEAYSAYSQCVQADPTFNLGWNNLGMVLIDLERYEEALEALYDSLRCDPNYGEAYNNMGFVLRRMQRPIDAAAAYMMYLQLEPEIEEKPRIQGWIQTVMTENGLTQLPPFIVPPKGGTAPAQAAPSQPEPAPAPAPAAQPAAEPPKIKKMAAWEVAAGDVATAAPVSATGEILDNAPQAAAPAAAPAMATPAPQPVFQPAPQQPPAAAPKPAAPATVAPAKVGGMKAPNPQQLIDLIEKGMDRFADGDFDGALNFFEQTLKLDPNFVEGLIGVAKVYVRQEKVNEGVELLQKAVALDANDPAAWYVLGFSLRSLEREVEAAKAYEHFLALTPDATDSSKMRQWIDHVKQIHGTNIGIEEEVPDDEQIVTEIDQQYKDALTKFQEGDVDTALREAIRLLNEDPGHLRSRLLLGRCYLKQKAFDNAIEQFDNCLVMRPDYPEGLYFLAQACDRKGVHEKAVASYKHYLEVAPDGPRAAKINEWLSRHGEGAAGKQAQCELCLRFFPTEEVSQHEGRATCRNCMAVMGGVPSSGGADIPADNSEGGVLPTLQSEPAEEEGAPLPPRGKGMVLVGVLLLLAAAGGAAFYLGKLDPILIQLGLKKKQVIVQPDIPKNPVDVPPVVQFDPTKVKVANDPVATVFPFTRWTYKPAIEGVDTLEQTNKGWKREFTLKDEPKGMAVDKDTGELSWDIDQLDFENLRRGQSWKVSLTIRGLNKGTDGKEKELFSLSKTFSLNCQFGYEVGPPSDLGLLYDDQPALAVGEFNGDGIADLAIASGRFRAGSLREYLQRKDNPFPAPTTLAKDTRFSAVVVADVDNNKTDDVIAADWQRGKLRMFYQDAQELMRGPEVAIGPGPIALAAADLDGDGSPEVATLLGGNGNLAITTVKERKFSEIKTVALSGGVARGTVIPWKSAEKGPGFLAILPLAEEPLQFVPFNNGQWDAGSVVKSKLEDEMIIVAATPLKVAGKSNSGSLAVLVAGKTNRLLLFEEKEGKFSSSAPALTLPALGVGIIGHDFNRDGNDDAFVVLLEESVVYFARSGQLFAGPRYNNTTRMLGQVIKYSLPSAEKPDLLLIDESRKGHVLRPVSAELRTIAPEPQKTEAPPADTKAAPDTKTAQPSKAAVPAPTPATKTQAPVAAPKTAPKPAPKK